MARILPVPIDVWNQLYDMLKSSSPVFADADNADTKSEAVLAGRRERALEQAEALESDVWEFVTGSGRRAVRCFFIAKDEQELRAKVAVAQIMAI
jgi:hypothetical protein